MDLSITVCILENDDLIEDALALLYESYIKHSNWKFNPNNPSGIRVEQKNGRWLLVDRFTQLATWLGAFDGDKLIGCARLCGMDEDGKFEIERYPNSLVIQSYLEQSRKNCREMGKVAVSPDYKMASVLKQLYLAAFEYCQKNRYSVYGGVGSPYIKTLLRRGGLYPKIEDAFKYEDTDDKPVSFYFIDYKLKEYDNVIRNFKNSVSIINKGTKYNVFEALEIVAPILPAPIYWHDRKGVVLGINDICLEGMGTTRENIIGKTPYDFHTKEIADRIFEHNEKIMTTEQAQSQEEIFTNFTTGKLVYALAVKAPLYDEQGNVVGIVGTSVDITAEKEAEQLRLVSQKQQAEIEKQQAIMEEQKKFRSLIEEVSQILNKFQISDIHDKLGKDKAGVINEEIKLTKREQEVLYLLSRHKSPKEISSILSDLEKKPISPKTVQGVIDKQLYPKFKVYSTGELVEKAHMYEYIPFILA